MRPAFGGINLTTNQHLRRMFFSVSNYVKSHTHTLIRKSNRYVRGVTCSKRASLRVLTKDEMESDETMNSFYEEKIRSRTHQLAAFLNLRCLFAPVIEALLLIDRALYLMESDKYHVEMRSLFDSRLSPRSIAILAWSK